MKRKLSRWLRHQLQLTKGPHKEVLIQFFLEPLSMLEQLQQRSKIKRTFFEKVTKVETTFVQEAKSSKIDEEILVANKPKEAQAKEGIKVVKEKAPIKNPSQSKYKKPRQPSL